MTTLLSQDVIHSFWIPKLAGKTDVVPNNVNTMWFVAEKPDTFFGLCAELCGIAHAQMRFPGHLPDPRRLRSMGGGAEGAA